LRKRWECMRDEEEVGAYIDARDTRHGHDFLVYGDVGVYRYTREAYGA
jgi:hypothetical protein